MIDWMNKKGKSRFVALQQLNKTTKRKQKNLGVGNRETIWTDYLNF